MPGMLTLRLGEALSFLYLETADYITINKLGDVHHNRTMRVARDVLALYNEWLKEPAHVAPQVCTTRGDTP
jgi:hypothetical protein